MEVNSIGGLHGDFFNEAVVGRHSTGEVNDFRRCKQCKTGSSYHYLLAAKTPIQCPHCGFVSLHVRI